MRADLILTNSPELVTVSGKAPKIGKYLDDIGIIFDGAFAVSDGRFIGVGTTSQILSDFESDNVVDAKGSSVLPGFVDPHTHVVFGGERSAEFAMRCEGKSYEQIMAAGGGIVSSVKMTREATDSELEESARTRLKRMVACGTTSVEIKSGYGLDTETEFRMLKVARKICAELGITCKTTFLGAHAIPKDANRADFIKLVKGEMLSVCKPFADYIDVFCDQGVFTNEETKDIVEHANMPTRLHVDELADTGGAALAASLGARSADHLIRASDEGFEALAKSGTVCTFLPGTSFFLNKPYARARRAVELGCTIALATDRNPGSCTVESMQFVIGLACSKLNLTVYQAIAAATINAAYSLDLADEIGSIEVGKRADFIVLDSPSATIIPYELTQNHVSKVYIAGKEATWVR
ncbi:MAG TPA: imidazolonepropionase [Caldisericia bacterium]|nr:imidazolonepropionase [Caldisericia bacterium]HPF48700.1 imidazolonepropionase [Caldisericia bacterium]HPI83640.1 imidazolonepropionase [Caldisericia bacterium]HPQ93155.1 imidazolonepropionase [Caldisericia bacterium]HRV75012.1 imidazolonepropionase [Caldisericia bacterium]